VKTVVGMKRFSAIASTSGFVRSFLASLYAIIVDRSKPISTLGRPVAIINTPVRRHHEKDV